MDISNLNMVSQFLHILLTLFLQKIILSLYIMSGTTKDSQFRLYIHNRIGGVMIIVLFSSLIDRGFEVRSDQTKENRIGI